jgi:hypothetical protein
VKEEGRLLSQLLNFFVKLFDVEVIIKKAYMISREWFASQVLCFAILSEVLTSPSKLVALIVVIQPKSYVPSLVVSPTVVTHGLVSSHVIVE